MDVMQLRRSLMMQMIGGAEELWNKKEITVPNNMTTSGDVYNWLNSAGVLPTNYTIFIAIRDNVDVTTWNDNDCVEASWFKEQGTTYSIGRVRSPQSSTSRYLQFRNPVNNPTDTINVYKDETFTIFYQ